MIAEPAAMRNPLAMCGAAAGITTYRNRSLRWPPNAPTTSSIGSVAASRPDRVNTKIGKNTSIAASAQTVRSLYPMIRANNGNRANSGVADSNTMNGTDIPATNRNRDAASAAARPNAVPIINAMNAVSIVCSAALR